MSNRNQALGSAAVRLSKWVSLCQNTYLRLKSEILQGGIMA